MFFGSYKGTSIETSYSVRRVGELYYVVMCYEDGSFDEDQIQNAPSFDTFDDALKAAQALKALEN
jgi:hypothetical protein